MLGTDRTRDRGENQNKREGDWMLIHTGGWGGGGALLYSLFFSNWKSGRRAIRVQTFTLA